jgi:hypothetical protein
MMEQNPAECAWMLEFCRGAGSVLEIGSREGATLRAMASVAKPGARICSIDLPSRNPNGLGDETGEKLTRAIWDLRAQGYDAEVHLGDSRSLIAQRWAELRGPFDFVFIDGDHTYEGVRQDWLSYGVLGKTVALHDINLDENDHGVPRAWSLIKDTGYRTVERIDGYQCGIGVVFR